MSVDIYIGESYCFSLVSIFKKDTKNHEVKLVVQNGALCFREKIAWVDVLGSSNSHFHSLLSYGDNLS